jgi:methyl coenzyme M reductase beta subunit
MLGRDVVRRSMQTPAVENEGNETLADRVHRIIKFEMTDDPLALAIAKGEDVAGQVGQIDAMRVTLRYCNALHAALIDLAEQADARLRRIES